MSFIYSTELFVLFFNSSPINAKKVNTTTSSDSYIGLWRNYLILCCSAASSSNSSTSAGSVRCSPPETLASTPDSGYSIDSRVGSSNACCKKVYMLLEVGTTEAYNITIMVLETCVVFPKTSFGMWLSFICLR